jgi:hypothetical protein
MIRWFPGSSFEGIERVAWGRQIRVAYSEADHFYTLGPFLRNFFCDLDEKIFRNLSNSVSEFH